MIHGVAEAMAEALSLRTAPISADDIGVSRSGKLRMKRFRFRTRYALRFGDLRDDQDQTLARAGTVRAAFNSPFRPFILSSTSVGQEGLDFHPYCHAVYHWNLPANPVDLEQREGRVHRYKGHAVRKNVAQRWGLDTLAVRLDGQRDPWEVMFDAAAEDRPEGVNELVPYWIYEVDGGARVERRVPMFAFSREVGKLERLKKGLALYRLAFGQPRQEDLVEILAKLAAEGFAPISLEPPEVISEGSSGAVKASTELQRGRAVDLTQTDSPGRLHRLLVEAKYRGVVLPEPPTEEELRQLLSSVPEPASSHSIYAGKRIVRSRRYQDGGNPRQPGSHGYKAYELIPLGDFGIRFEDLLARIRELPAKSSRAYGAGGINHITWDLDHGFTYLIEDKDVSGPE